MAPAALAVAALAAVAKALEAEKGGCGGGEGGGARGGDAGSGAGSVEGSGGSERGRRGDSRAMAAAVMAVAVMAMIFSVCQRGAIATARRAGLAGWVCGLCASLSRPALCQSQQLRLGTAPGEKVTQCSAVTAQEQ